ncbi:hypothetical protein SPRG_09329 [Saprolegnia parasitica CBS 223.65]|uniref:F-box domain-containing protein n=1 Tax=Saprolegnia parasitica (strain CBS 223.65) TaxID=695850 RepID=A0A067C4E2_SAPPC|nr:hypothetical protein SPRG_09329 [Saprolegnia parasitica CBS 223.65]KDO25388.1 hypothetical protein SPRG_09329 [Saprolegnia parasitica CBS 223.65]|eukprot:XP_012203816.1 hypothetical protein SPRG_09329 [Saprolegnia parasitica CBS 223.65]
MWPLPPVALQILDCLDDADDAFAFLQAAPNDCLDDALDALRALLAMGLALPVWPTPHVRGLVKAYNASPSVVMMALPLFKKITFGFCDKPSIIGHNTVLAPTTAVSANVQLDDFVKVRAALGNWLPNLAHLRVYTRHTYGLVPTTKDDLATCRGLRSLAIQHSRRLDQDEFDAALMAVVAASAQIESVCVSATRHSYISDCTSLLAWLALPMARHLELNCIDFHGDLGAELATTMLTSSTLEKIHLFGAPSLTRALLSPSSPPLPPQLRHLAIIVDRTEADATALAAKIATSRLHTLELAPRASCDVTSVASVLPQVPTLTKLALQGAHLTAFPPLRHLWHLDLFLTTFSDEAIASLAALLGSLPKLVHLDLG